VSNHYRNHSYSKLSIPAWIQAEAQVRADKLPVYQNSHRGKAANQIGCLGEVISEHWFSMRDVTFAPIHITKHDYKIDNRLSLEVKTKDRTVLPKIDFDCSLPLYNHDHQQADLYLFISLIRDRDDNSNRIERFTDAFILGSIFLSEIDAIGIPFLEGEKDWRNGTKFWTSCLNVEMGQLISVEETLNIFKGHASECSRAAVPNPHTVQEMQKRINAGQYKDRKLPQCS